LPELICVFFIIILGLIFSQNISNAKISSSKDEDKSSVVITTIFPVQAEENNININSNKQEHIIIMSGQVQDPEALSPLLRERKPASFGNQEPSPPPGIAARHPIQLLKITSACGFCTWFLNNKLNFFHDILHSHKVSHTWFKLGLAFSIAILAIKGYMEIYEGKIKKQEGENKNNTNKTP